MAVKCQAQSLPFLMLHCQQVKRLRSADGICTYLSRTASASALEQHEKADAVAVVSEL